MLELVRTHPRRSVALVAATVGLGLTALGGAGLGTGVAHADFVCPVLPISDNAIAHSQAGFIPISGGDYSILPGGETSGSQSIHVPANATNQNGAGSPGGAHASPGESGYTAIWNTD